MSFNPYQFLATLTLMSLNFSCACRKEADTVRKGGDALVADADLPETVEGSDIADQTDASDSKVDGGELAVERWRFALPADRHVSGGFSTSGGPIYACIRLTSFDINGLRPLVALDRATGEKLWETPIGGARCLPPMAGPSGVWVAYDVMISNDPFVSYIAVLDAYTETGKLRWRYQLAPESGNSGGPLGWHSGAAAHGPDGTTYLVGDNQLLAIDDQGKEKWRRPVGSSTAGASQGIVTDRSPILFADAVFVSGRDGMLRKFGLDGTPLGSYGPASQPKCPYIVTGGALVGSIGSDLTFVDPVNLTATSVVWPPIVDGPCPVGTATGQIAVASHPLALYDSTGKIWELEGDSSAAAPSVDETGNIATVLVGGRQLMIVDPKGKQQKQIALEDALNNRQWNVLADDFVVYSSATHIIALDVPIKAPCSGEWCAPHGDARNWRYVDKSIVAP